MGSKTLHLRKFTLQALFFLPPRGAKLHCQIDAGPWPDWPTLWIPIEGLLAIFLGTITPVESVANFWRLYANVWLHYVTTHHE